MPLQKVHELTFLWFGLQGPLLIEVLSAGALKCAQYRARTGGVVLSKKACFCILGECLKATSENPVQEPFSEHFKICTALRHTLRPSC